MSQQSEERPRGIAQFGFTWHLLAGALWVVACGGSAADAPAAPTPVLTTISVSLGAPTLQVGQVTQATASAADQNGGSVAPGAISWASSSPTIAAVSSTGNVSALSAGVAQIIATAGGKSAQAALTVVAAAALVSTVQVSMPVSSLEVGAAVVASATPLDQNNVPIVGKTVAWTSDNTGVATVASDGTVTGVGAGTVNITAAVDGKTGAASAVITVWTFDGVVLSNADFGGAPGALADVSVLQLADGRYRMIIGGYPNSPGGFGSAISADGVKFTMEPGVRVSTPVQIAGIATTFVKPVGVRMDDGRIRLFASANADASGGIYSFTSSDDGVTFTPDAGVRLSTAAAGVPKLGVGSLVKMKGGGWRMYVNDVPDNAVDATGVVRLSAFRTLSATSTDLTTWTMESGVRVGPGATLSGGAQSAASILNADGSTTLIYFRAETGITYQSTSADGRTFDHEYSTGFGINGRVPIPAIDTYAITLSDGSVRMYFNYGNLVGGTIYTAHHPAYANR